MVEIVNVPLGGLDGFFLDKVITSVFSLFPGLNEPTHVLVDKQFVADWINARRGDGNGTTPLKELEGPLGNRIMALNGFGGDLSIVRSECIPRYIGAQTGTDSATPPLASPSALVSTTPVSGRLSSKTLAEFTAS